MTESDKRRLASLPGVRRLVLPVFRRINFGDITARHAITGDPLRMHSFRHRGYWYYGRSRERKTLEVWQRWILPGQEVIEVGGHIGYMTVLLSRLVGEGEAGGRVTVFEPGLNNLPYLRHNVRMLDNVTLQTSAVGNRNGRVKFYLESLTGQNNSVYDDYEGLVSNSASANLIVEYEETFVEMVTLDEYCMASGMFPDWLKIDVEGHEMNVLLGARETISRHLPAITIEITRSNLVVGEWLRNFGYSLHRADSGKTVEGVPKSGDYFALHGEKHGGIALDLSTGH